MCDRNYTAKERMIISTFKLNHPHVCEYCGKSLTDKDKVTVDHKTPVCRGGETAEENLTIACEPCNQEKDDMTVEEYIVYKQKQQEILDGYEVNHMISGLASYYEAIAKRSNEVNDEFIKTDKQIIQLQQDIMWNKFNACEGYLLSKKLNELLLRKEELRIKKLGFNRLNTLLGNSRIQITDVKCKIQVDVKNANKPFLRRYVENTFKDRNKSNVISIDKYMGAAR